jgi:hypothetical protein
MDIFSSFGMDIFSVFGIDMVVVVASNPVLAPTLMRLRPLS